MSSRFMRARLRRGWCWVFSLLIAGHALVLALFGMRAIRAEQQLRDQQAQAARLADATIANAIDHTTALLHRIGSEAFIQPDYTPATVRSWIGAPPWLDIRKTDVDPTGTLLGVGELAAITLAEQLHADLVLMDDVDGRIEAERRHLKVIGTLGVLRVAAFSG